MSFYEKHIFVCENSREPGKRISCGWSNSKKIKDQLKLKVSELSPNSKIRVQMSGCLDRCELGPVQVCYPQEVWVSLKTEEDIDRFVKAYIVNGDVSSIQDLLIQNS
jgi:(2Fe-2S) ferredoxin